LFNDEGIDAKCDNDQEQTDRDNQRYHRAEGQAYSDDGES
jgi:hypothetical protein